MSLKDLVTEGRVQKPFALIVYGPVGIGKTTFGDNEGSIFITAEEIEEVQAAKLPKCTKWADFVNQLRMVRDEAHDYKNLVIDTIDAFESLLWEDIVSKDKASSMATACGGYGNAYTEAARQMTLIRDEYLAPIRDKGVNIVILAHSSKVKVDDIYNQTSYNSYEMKLHKNSKGFGVYTVFSEWVQAILFANYKTLTVRKDKKDFAVGDGERVLYCTPKPTHEAKNRYNFPDEMNFDFKGINEAVNKFYSGEAPVDVEQLKEEISHMLDKIEDEDLKAKTAANVSKVGNDVNRLLKARDYIQGVI